MKTWLLFKAPWIPLFRLIAWPYRQIAMAQMRFIAGDERPDGDD